MSIGSSTSSISNEDGSGKVWRFGRLAGCASAFGGLLQEHWSPMALWKFSSPSQGSVRRSLELQFAFSKLCLAASETGTRRETRGHQIDANESQLPDEPAGCSKEPITSGT
ncbi:hypothetical protein CMUS01_09178 [Colletotrichum musicola]|uniref:Uncharacterized protein n=1 Tax=Colletotrichum musicola TaxID=2175873 RepID=A0A8H6K940_9PEZI|nr:hypothetical protein CMUS01_09178 [Colletotrichum musicola]